jgi:hypothetical protein
MAALAALHLFLASHPDLRIGQALVNLASSKGLDVWDLEDEQLVEACST